MAIRWLCTIRIGPFIRDDASGEFREFFLQNWDNIRQWINCFILSVDDIAPALPCSTISENKQGVLVFLAVFIFEMTPDPLLSQKLASDEELFAASILLWYKQDPENLTISQCFGKQWDAAIVSSTMQFFQQKPSDCGTQERVFKRVFKDDMNGVAERILLRIQVHSQAPLSYALMASNYYMFVLITLSTQDCVLDALIKNRAVPILGKALNVYVDLLKIPHPGWPDQDVSELIRVSGMAILRFIQRAGKIAPILKILKECLRSGYIRATYMLSRHIAENDEQPEFDLGTTLASLTHDLLVWCMRFSVYPSILPRLRDSLGDIGQSMEGLAANQDWGTLSQFTFQRAIAMKLQHKAKIWKIQACDNVREAC